MERMGERIGQKKHNFRKQFISLSLTTPYIHIQYKSKHSIQTFTSTFTFATNLCVSEPNIRFPWVDDQSEWIFVGRLWCRCWHPFSQRFSSQCGLEAQLPEGKVTIYEQSWCKERSVCILYICTYLLCISYLDLYTFKNLICWFRCFSVLLQQHCGYLYYWAFHPVFCVTCDKSFAIKKGKNSQKIMKLDWGESRWRNYQDKAKHSCNRGVASLSCGGFYHRSHFLFQGKIGGHIQYWRTDPIRTD